MFLNMLTEDQQKLFLEIAHLVSISDDPLLWDGKTEAELTGSTDLSKVSFKKSEHEEALMDAFVRECTASQATSIMLPISKLFESSDWVWTSLKNNLKPLPLGKQNDPNERIAASSEVMRKALKDRDKCMITAQPSAPKIMLYELMLLALADGEISAVESALLKHFADQQKMDDETYSDLLERAKGMNVEANKTLSLILE